MVKGSAGAKKVARGILETSGVKSDGARKLLFKMERALAILGLPEMPKRNDRRSQSQKTGSPVGSEAIRRSMSSDQPEEGRK
jgi:hypothetical protein